MLEPMLEACVPASLLCWAPSPSGCPTLPLRSKGIVMTLFLAMAGGPRHCKGAVLRAEQQPAGFVAGCSVYAAAALSAPLVAPACLSNLSWSPSHLVQPCNSSFLSHRCGSPAVLQPCLLCLPGVG